MTTTTVYDEIERLMGEEKFLRLHGYGKADRALLDNTKQSDFDSHMMFLQVKILELKNELQLLQNLLSTPEDKAFFQRKESMINEESEQVFQTSKTISLLSDRCLIAFTSDSEIESLHQKKDWLIAIIHATR
jgi:hypothetical protein